MITSIQCPSCDSFGCKECNYFGWFLKDSTNGNVYYVQKTEGKVSLGAKKVPDTGWTKIKNKIFGEPHDLLWAINAIREVIKRQKY